MVKMLTSDLKISFWESHYPPLLVSTSSALAFFFFFKEQTNKQQQNILKAHNPRLKSKYFEL